MRNYKVTITETLQMTVEVRADNLAEAEEKVEEKWKYILLNLEFILFRIN